MEIKVIIENGIKSIVYTELTDKEEQQLVDVYDGLDIAIDTIIEDGKENVPYLQVWLKN